MAYILNIETATKNCSVALANDGVTVCVKEIATIGYSHAEQLHLFIESVLQEAGITYQDLSAIAVSQGPGSYTGLRIGVSAAKGLCFALDIPLIAVDTLRILACSIEIDEGLIVPMIDARRMEVYNAIFDPNMNVIRAVQAEVIDENAFDDIPGVLHFIGDGILKCKTVLQNDRFKFYDEIVYPSADQMSVWSHQKFEQSEFVDVAYFEPFYLKDFLITAPK